MLVEKFKRVAAMHPREAAYRLHERVRAESGRLRARAGISLSALRLDIDCSSFLDYLRSGPARRFYFSGDSRGSLEKIVRNNFPVWIETARAEADQLCGHQVPILGFGTRNLGPEIDWHRDPVTGNNWPVRYWTDYDLVHDCRPGDPKSIHELNRHQHLSRLAKAFFLTGNEPYALEVLSQIEGWIAQNPPFLGINWHSSLEMALRSVSWLWSMFFIASSRCWTETQARRIAASLFAQIDHICRYPSVYSSPNTHLIGEATALLLAGLIFTEHPRSSTWRDKGRRILMQQLDTQVSDEGVHAELSSYYLCYTLEFYLQALALAQHNGFALPGRIRDKTERMIEALMHLAAPDRSLPLLGDDDGGRALALCHTDYRFVDDMLCTGAVMFGRGDFRLAAGRFCEETFWLLGGEGVEAFERIRPAAPLETSASYPDAGYFVQRSDWGPHAGRLLFDCGGLGKLGGGHGHSDGLSFTLWAGGREFITDPGTFVYNGAPEWRDFFRSTRAHNTAVIDGRGQSTPGGTFRWKTMTESRFVRQCVLPGIECIEGEHHEYEDLSTAVVHRRRIFFLKPHYWVLLDSFTGDGEHELEFNCQFAPEVELSAESRRTILNVDARSGDASLKLAVFAAAPLDWSIKRGSERPIRGWVSRRYGQREPAPSLKVAITGSLPTAALTILHPCRRLVTGGASIVPLSVTGNRVLACSVADEDNTDVLVSCPHRGEVRVGNVRATGEFFWLRLNGHRLERFLALNATSLAVGGEAVFEFSEPAPLVSEATAPLPWTATRDLADLEVAPPQEEQLA